MSRFVIAGGNKLRGQIRVDGAKNAALPILAATILNGGKNIIHDCPNIKDVEVSLKILELLGCTVERNGTTVIVDSSTVNNYHITDNLTREMRSSFIFLGAMLSRCKKATLSYPGGCEIGPRPIDLHLKALRQLGVKIHEEHGYIYCDATKLVSGDINLNFPSVGATENIMLAAIKAKGITIIRNAAKEPEIIDLQNYLNGMGAKISGAGTGVIMIQGVDKLNDVEHRVIPDRIAASTYLTAAAITGGNIELTNVNPEHIQAVIAVLKECGCRIKQGKDTIYLSRTSLLRPVDVIRTLPYPGFPTDMQAPMMSLLTLAEGTSIVSETIFENRYKHVEELIRMGADIMVDGRVAVIRGVKKLTGAEVRAKDLRGGAALVLAGLAAEGLTVVEGIHHVDRGYDRLEEKLRLLGADLKRMV